MMLLLGLLVPSAACRGVGPQVIPDPTVPHQLSQEIKEAYIWTRMPDGKMAEAKVYIPKGYWIAGPPVVEDTPH
jgi:hypothetical protein